MKKLIIFAIVLLLKITSFSDSTFAQTNQDSLSSRINYDTVIGDTIVKANGWEIRGASLIFLEHRYLKEENTNLYEQVDNLQQMSVLLRKDVVANEVIISDLTNLIAVNKGIEAESVTIINEKLKLQKKKTRKASVLAIGLGVLCYFFATN